MFRNILKAIAILAIVSGVVWVLQGINILPGSFMTGDPQWAINGAFTILAGSIFLWFLFRKP